LDKDTSGCLVVAKSEYARQQLLLLFQQRQIEKTYRALLVGNMKKDSGTINAPVGRHPVNRKKMAVVDRGGREAVTHWKVLERFPRHTYIEVRLETGRTHQIRVHMASLGFPVAGDPLYGGKRSDDAVFCIQRQWLHAYRLKFVHPVTGTTVECTAPLWADLQATLELLRRED